MRESWKRQIALVVLPVDEFTGNVIIDPALAITAGDMGKPLIKAEGFRVFSVETTDTGKLSAEQNAEKMNIEVTLRGSFYQKMQISVPFRQIDRKNPVIKAGMKPSRSYPFPPGTVYIEGMLPEHAVLWVARAEGPGALRLRVDARAGDDRLHIHQQELESRVGSSYLLLGKGDEEMEWVTCAQTADGAYVTEGIYQLKECICRDYMHSVAKLYKCLCYESDVLGRDCFLALPGEPGREMTICCHLTSDHRFKVRGGETLQLDFSQM